MKKDPLMKILNEYLDAHPNGTWEENRTALMMILWLRDQGYLQMQQPVEETHG